MDGDLDVTSVREVVEDGEAANRVRTLEAAGGEVVEERLRVARDVENVLEAADEPQRVGVETTARRVDEEHVKLPRRRVAEPVGRGAARVRRDPRRRPPYESVDSRRRAGCRAGRAVGVNRFDWRPTESFESLSDQKSVKFLSQFMYIC